MRIAVAGLLGCGLVVAVGAWTWWGSPDDVPPLPHAGESEPPVASEPATPPLPPLPESTVSTPGQRLAMGRKVLREIGTGLSSDELVQALLRRWLPNHAALRQALRTGAVARWVRSLDVVIAGERRAALVEFAYAAFDAEARMLASSDTAVKAAYDPAAMRRFDETQRALARRYTDAIVASAQRLLSLVTPGERAAIHALAPESERPWLDRAEVTALREH